MASPVEVDKTRDPLQVRAFRGKRITTGPHIDALQVKKAGGTGRNENANIVHMLRLPFVTQKQKHITGTCGPAIEWPFFIGFSLVLSVTGFASD